MVNRRTSSERWAREVEQGSGGSRPAVQCGRKKSAGLGHWPLPYQPIYEGFIGVGVRMRMAAHALAAGCQSENVIADAAGPETFIFGELFRLLASRR